MKAITQQWLDFAKADLTACKSLLPNVEMTNIVTFHAQQAVEKCFKAIVDENGIKLIRVHTLLRLFGLIRDKVTFTVDLELLTTLDNIYTTSRYPCDLGLTPEGKPTMEQAQQLYEFAKNIYDKTLETIEN